METVLLLNERDGKETLFMKNEEVAFVYLKDKLTGAPTSFE